VLPSGFQVTKNLDPENSPIGFPANLSLSARRSANMIMNQQFADSFGIHSRRLKGTWTQETLRILSINLRLKYILYEVGTLGKQFRKILIKAFGQGEGGLPDIPTKVSNVKISRFIFYKDRGGCPFCFPHGIETNNSKWSKNRKSWKLRRAKQYRVKKGG
jgi:hypothetical protein